YKFFLPFFWPKKNRLLQLSYLGVGLCLLAERVLNMLIPLQLGRIVSLLSQSNGIKKEYSDKNTEAIPNRELLIIAGLQFLCSSGGIPVARKYLWLLLENSSYIGISTAAFEKIMSLSGDFHDGRHPDKSWESINRGLSVRYSFRTILFQILPLIIDLLLDMSMLCIIFGANMALITAAVIATFLWSSWKILSLRQERKKKLIADQEKEQSILRESTSNWRTAVCFNRASYERSQYRSALMNKTNASVSLCKYIYLESVIQSSLLIAGVMGTCFLVLCSGTQGDQTVGGLVVLLGYWAQLAGPLRFFASGLQNVRFELINAEELISLMKEAPSVVDVLHAMPLMLEEGVVRFRDVSFSYDGPRRVLHRLNFKAVGGSKTAIVGEAGAGKSTILQLILRLYDSTDGKITIDGQNIREVTQESLRANIGIVPQNPTLSHGTILENIKQASAFATDEQVYEACKAVALHDRFLALADGYQSLVGEGEVDLSQEELRRIAFARVIVKNPKIVLLDEPKREIERKAEESIQANLDKFCAGRTTIVVSHQLSTVTNAQKIFVVRNGKIVEHGSHNLLLKTGGHYSQMWSQQ
ncbi:hypothetical protein ASPZODRAFT_51935, partial [Penicilliopsis zonata CBS 506.65]